MSTVGVVLGSGLGAFAETLENRFETPYADIAGWPAVTAAGHAGKLVTGRLGDTEVVVLSGRAHYYEGYTGAEVTLGIRELAKRGVDRVILTNAAGAIDTELHPGELVLISDHINLMGQNPLAGPNDDRFGPRFPDMSDVYASRLRGVAAEAARASDVALAHGVYAALLGPSYETPAEIRFLRSIGADAVGMSTVPEAIVARHMGIEVLGISCITNMAAGVLPAPLNHAEVMDTARRVRGQFVSLLEGIIGRLA